MFAATLRGSPWARVTTSVTALAVASALSVGLPAATAASPSAPSTADKVRPQLEQQLETKGEATFWVRFQPADLSAASAVKDWDERGKAVHEALTSAAATSQVETRKELEAAGASYESFWATNAIRVEAGDSALVQDIAANSDVLGIYPSFDYRLEEPKQGTAEKAPDGIEWGISNIKADQVWEQYGVSGEGLVIASIDSGVDYEHPALVNQYRGNNGDGTFTHDYNWFDASGACDGAPCDDDGHGTHTMGTMVGTDGGSNQIGVAPGATWIEANGCCPSDAALIESGEWMLAPTDLAGENPDVTKRPNIVNNSWGTQTPSNDPFMEDIETAWAASGIWGAWSNGNNGPSCETSGSPGSRIINYSSGAYDINNAIASFSSRGAGQDGEIKPNISAPGVNVRSSLPGGGYGSYSGTSMASPHMAGAVALLWAAAPSLIGDIEGTRALLDGTAIDAGTTTCGGSTADNNVFGEGRLDALALLQAAPVGDTGTLTGTVTDAESGDPLDDAEVELSGEFDRTVTTDDDGSFSVRLATGEYTAEVSKFGYGTDTGTVTIDAEQTTTHDVALTAAPSVTLSGTVTDTSGHGWPLYAKVDLGGPAPDVWTDPETGEYSVTVPSGATYAMTVTADIPGYLPATSDVEVGSADVGQDVGLEVNTATCSVPGYRFNTAGVTEDFDAGTLPDGWTVEDNIGNGQVWRFDNPDGRDNLTGGAGGFAIMDSDFYGSGGTQDTSLVTPVIDMSSLTAPVVGFRQDYNNLGDFADVDVSIDGGATWETVLHQTTDVRGPREDVLQLPTAAGQSQVQVRFRQYDADFDWWWEVDDVFVGNRTCDPVKGGLVVGIVSDANTGDGIVGAKVRAVEVPDATTTTRATPGDEALGDGYYWLFSGTVGTVPLEASANQYETKTASATVVPNYTTRTDVVLGAGHLVVEPGSLEVSRQLGANPITRTFTLTNDGTGAVDVELSERGGDFSMLGADGSKSSARKMAQREGAELQRIKAPVSFGQMATGQASNASPDAVVPHDAPWAGIADYPSVVMDNRVVHLDGVAYSIAGGNGTASTAKVFAYDPATLTWTEKASLPDARNAVAAGVVDGQIVVTGGWAAAGPSPVTWAYDPAADTWTAKANAPQGLSASGQAVADGKLYVVGGCTTASCTPMSAKAAAYDLASDTWTPIADYPVAVAFASCGGIDGTVYCTGGNNGSAATAASYAYDPGADAWTAIADAPTDTWASGYAVANGTLVVQGGVQGGAITNATFAYDPAAEAWADLPNANTPRYRGGLACGLYKVGGSSGNFNAQADSETLPGFEDCGSSAQDVEWLSVSPTTATIAPGDSLTVEVTMDPQVAQPGTYTAAVGVKSNTPGRVEPITVTMDVTPPKAWGKLAGTVSGRSCSGQVAGLGGATLQVDSWAGSWSFETESDGSYAYWFNSGANPLQLIAAKDGYAPQTRQVKLKKGATVRADFTLRRSGC